MPPLSLAPSAVESDPPPAEPELETECDDSRVGAARMAEPITLSTSASTPTPTPALLLLPPPPPARPTQPVMSLLSPSTWTFRYIHSTIAVVAVLPLLLTLLTGFAYRFSRGVLHSEKANVKWLMDLHTMSTLSLHTVYPLLVALLTCIMAATGVQLGSLAKALQRLRAGRAGAWSAVISLPTKYNLRTVHRISTTLLLLPLALTALTGAVWTVQQHYLAYPREQSSWLMYIHQGSYLSEIRGPVIYTASLLLLTLPALLSGLTLLPLWRQWRSGTASRSRGGGGIQSGGGVRYTMLSVKQAFEGDDDEHEHDNDAVGTGMMDEEQSGLSQDDEDIRHPTVSTASNGR